MDALLLEKVTHAYDGFTAVDGIDLRIGPGELVCLLGPSGCGKTTVLRVAAGLEELQRGRVLIAGREMARYGFSAPPEARGVGLVFQDYALFPHLTVAENVAFGLIRERQPARRAVAMEALARIGMGDFAERYPHTLSGGEQQRVALARALAPQPELLLLDEPFSGLDIRLRDQVRDETLRVLRAAEISTLIVTHDPEEAMYMADRIAVMRAGQILQEGPPAELYSAPQSAFVARFLSDVNSVHGTVEGGVVASIFGHISAGGIADGARVDVLIRPEALRIGAGDGARAEVVAVHPLGHSNVVVPRLEDGGRELRARVAGAVAPRPGTRVAVELDGDQTFVFPCDHQSPLD